MNGIIIFVIIIVVLLVSLFTIDQLDVMEPNIDLMNKLEYYKPIVGQMKDEMPETGVEWIGPRNFIQEESLPLPGEWVTHAQHSDQMKIDGTWIVDNPTGLESWFVEETVPFIL